MLPVSLNSWTNNTQQFIIRDECTEDINEAHGLNEIMQNIFFLSSTKINIHS